jgi:CheY-specific phosphatase CheX
VAKTKTITTDDILVMLCNSVRKVLTAATKTPISYSAMVQRITRTCLRPDIGCFVLFDGGFSGLVIMNFSAASAMELYRAYMISMGMPESELASRHTSEEVGNMLGELMNQIVGDFTGNVGHELQVCINQNQPKMLTINKEVMVSIDTNLDRPQARRVTFNTTSRNVFYMELAMDKTDFIKLHDFEREETDPDRIVEEQARQTAGAAGISESNAVSDAQLATIAADQAFLDALGL